MTQRNNDEDPRQYGFLRTMQTVAWGMLGIRKGRGHKEDFSKLNPLHLIVVGLAATALFVFLLIAAARWFIGYLT